eukprot:CAMPEP_0115064150 /NCGR_PEP_ID=MMETSP0227-20121206/9516_1 /TAXON_ID=89957 /ORGANISM="Polarella glacialis, Strain CCMP 1383" /LENGTH=72 /DNA_ID=CAMNT_0002449757 /DNA_START=148 /DNA_END=362 /DNA_ORIENTATION=-
MEEMYKWIYELQAKGIYELQSSKVDLRHWLCMLNKHDVLQDTMEEMSKWIYELQAVHKSHPLWWDETWFYAL